MEKVFYYRPSFGRETEIIPESFVKRIRKVWGNQPYNQIEERVMDHNYGSGLPIVTEIMATIQCDRRLNERQAQLEERIKKGLTKSRAMGMQYVEEKILLELIYDAKTLFVKDGGDLWEAFGVEKNGKKYDFALPYKEFFRLFGLPYNSIMDKVEKSEEEIGEIEKPKKFRDIKYQVDKMGNQQSSYKYYYVKGKLHNRSTFVQTGLPYVGKVYQSYDGYRARSYGQEYVTEEWIQIYVHDYHNRNWALQNVVDYLLKKKMITLSK
jgi:hypothetical protein